MIVIGVCKFIIKKGFSLQFLFNFIKKAFLPHLKSVLSIYYI